MRNKIILTILLLLLLLLIFSAFSGLKIGNLQILSVSQINDKNKFLEDKLLQASQLTSIDYSKSVEDLEATYVQYNIKKEKYEELVRITKDKENNIYEVKEYDIEYLWKVIGKYARTLNLEIGLDVKKSTEYEKDNLYNLNFTVSGTYTNTSEFIKELEDDSDLNFRIYDFKMVGSEEIIDSYFTVKNLKLDSVNTGTETTNLNVQ